MTENQTITERSIPDYTKYPREFITYKWFRPLITGILFVVILLFYATGVGISQISSQSTLLDLGFAIVLDVVYILVILFCKKRGMFDVRKADDAAAYNAKIKAKLAKKAAKKARRS
jgi:hypothetical protein